MAVNYTFTVDDKTITFNELDELICSHLHQPINKNNYCYEYLYLTHCIVPMCNKDIDTLTAKSDFAFLKNSLQGKLDSTKQLMQELNITIHIW
jgi:hypothetical protein